MASAGSSGFPILCGERVNLSVYKQLSSGTVVRVAGRFHTFGVLTTTDAGIISVELGRLATQFAGQACFVEVVGTKVTDDCMRAMSIVPLPNGEGDEDLWNEAIMLAQIPALRHLFVCSEERSRLAAPSSSEVYEQQPLSQTQEYGSRGDPGEGWRGRAEDCRACVAEGVSQGAEQEAVSPTQMLGQRLERDAELEAELDAFLSGAG